MVIVSKKWNVPRVCNVWSFGWLWPLIYDFRRECYFRDQNQVRYLCVLHSHKHFCMHCATVTVYALSVQWLPFWTSTIAISTFAQQGAAFQSPMRTCWQSSPVSRCAVSITAVPWMSSRWLAVARRCWAVVGRRWTGTTTHGTVRKTEGVPYVVVVTCLAMVIWDLMLGSWWGDDNLVFELWKHRRLEEIINIGGSVT